MNHFFQLEGPIFTFLTKLCDVLLLSLLWLVFSLPVVTLGASSAALYQSVHKVLLHNKGYVFSTFWKSFRENIKQGIILLLITAFIAVFSVVSFLFARSMNEHFILESVYFAVTLLSALLFFTIVLHAFPILARFYMKTTEILKASIAFSVTRPTFTLLLIVIFILCVTAVLIAPFTLFVLPACYCMAAERILEPAFLRAIEHTDKSSGEEDAEKPVASSPE